jgi:drug/metabolite transporter (DMT)-like permease
MGTDHKGKAKYFSVVMLQLIIIIYTLSGIAAKFASHYSFMSWNFILFYCLEIFILGIYAILWQQIIKKFDLSVAYANRSVAIFWSLIWSAFIFGETISIKNIIGVLIIFTGTYIVNTGDKENKHG